MKTPRILLAVLAATFVAAPAFAQSGPITLRVDVGNAMVSTGGEFATAPSGTQLAPGSRVMLSEGSRATLVYANGCTQPLSAAGVFGVPATCVVPAGSTGGAGVDVAGLGIVSGIAVAGAAVLSSMDDEPYVEPEPVSR
jgi:hypothetical protein